MKHTRKKSGKKSDVLGTRGRRSFVLTFLSIFVTTQKEIKYREMVVIKNRLIGSLSLTALFPFNSHGLFKQLNVTLNVLLSQEELISSIVRVD